MEQRQGFSSEKQRERRLHGYQRIRQELGIPEPSEHHRKLKRLRNERHRAKKAAEAAKLSNAA